MRIGHQYIGDWMLDIWILFSAVMIVGTIISLKREEWKDKLKRERNKKEDPKSEELPEPAKLPEPVGLGPHHRHRFTPEERDIMKQARKARKDHIRKQERAKLKD